MNIGFCYLGGKDPVDYLLTALQACLEKQFMQNITCLNLTDGEGRFRFRCQSELRKKQSAHHLNLLHCGDVETYWGKLMLWEADFLVLVIAERDRDLFSRYLEQPVLRKHPVIYTFVDYWEPSYGNPYHLEESSICMIPANRESSELYERNSLCQCLKMDRLRPTIQNELFWKGIKQLSFLITQMAEHIRNEQREDFHYERSI